MIKKATFIIFLFSASVLFAQDASMQISRKIITPLTSFDLSYLNMEGSGSAPTLFTITLLPASPISLNKHKIRFEAKLKSALLDKTVYIGETGFFSIPIPITITSNQLFDQESSNDTLSIQNPILILGDEELQELILNSGTLATGAVTFGFELIEIAHSKIVSAGEMNLDIANVRYVKLVSPGTDARFAGENPPLVYSTFPQFFWSSDLLPVHYDVGSDKFEISVYENPNNMYSLAEIENQKPLWQEKIRSTNIAQYPLSGVTSLENGRTYYWKVKGLLQGPTAGEIESELFSFKIADFQKTGGLSPDQQSVLQGVEALLGSEYANIMKELKDHVPTGEMQLNGQGINQQGLSEIIAGLGQKKITIKKVRFE